MKINIPTKYNILNSDVLFDIINLGFSMELGSISLDISERLIKGEEVSLDKLISPFITTNGIDSITRNNKQYNPQEEIDLQLNFLKDQINQLSSNILVVTFGTVTYYDHEKEHVAPIIVYPAQLNFEKNTIQFLEQPFLNSSLFSFLKKEDIIADLDIKKLEKRFQNINSISDIDELLIKLSAYKNINIGTVNYLTTLKIDYQEEYFNPDRFSKIKGVGEYHIFEFLDKYYQSNIHQITSLNIEQKYALLKYHNGENICIDGALGSGKTEIAMNIIADAVLNQKKVLYVNQSKQQINEFKKRMTILGLQDYIYDGCSNLEKYPKIDNKLTLPKKKPSLFFNNIEVFGNKYMGYRYSDILSKLIILNKQGFNQYYDIEPFSLEYSEIEEICVILDQIENLLKNITPIKDNIWRDVSTIHETVTPKELKAYFDELYNQTKNFIEKINIITSSNHLKPINNLTDFFSLNQAIERFIDYRPLNSWFDKDFYEDAYAALKDIEAQKQNFKIVRSYYLDYIYNNYHNGDMKKVYEALDETNLLLVERILSNETRIEDILKQISKVINEIYQSNNVFNTYFKHGSLNTNLNFYLKLYRYLINTYINNLWAKDYLNNPLDYLNAHEDFIHVFDKYYESKKEFAALVKDYSLNYNDFIVLNKNIDITNKTQVIKLLKNKYNNKQSNIDKLNIDYDELYQKYTSFIRDGIVVNNTYPYLIESTNNFDIEWENYSSFLYFIKSLKSNESELFIDYINNFDIIEYPTSSNLYIELRNFKYNYFIISDIIEKLSYFNININQQSFMLSLASIQENLPIIKKYVVFKEMTNSFFKKNNVTADDVLTLIKKDDELDRLNNLMAERKEKYLNLFGEQSYQGEKTNTEVILKTISCFRIYQAMLSPDFNQSNIQEDIFLNLINSSIKLMSVYFNWNRSFRAVFNSFRYADFSFQKLTFESMLVRIDEFRNKFDELSDTYAVISKIEKLKEHGIYKFINLLYNSTLTTNLSNKFLSSILKKYYDYLFNHGVNFSDELLHQEVVNNNDVENYNCIKSRIELEKRYKKYSSKTIIDFLRKSNTNNKDVRRILSCPKNKNITVIDTLTLINIEGYLSQYDLVVIDDAHISTISKYGDLNFNSQLVVLGDRDANPSTYNGLLNRISKDHIIHFTKRYYDMNEDLCNIINNKNECFYNPHNKIEIITLNNINELGNIIINNYLNKNKSICIKTTNTYQSIIYKNIINTYYNSEINDLELNDLLSNISIENIEDNILKYSEIVYLYVPDFNKIDISIKQRIFRNLNTKDLYICDINKCINTIDIYELLKTHHNKELLPNSFEYFFIKEINKAGIKTIPTSGIINVMIPTKDKMIGVVIVDDKVFTSYYYTDELTYAKVIFEKNDWSLLIFSLYDVFLDMNNVVNQIKKEYGDLNGDR